MALGLALCCVLAGIVLATAVSRPATQRSRRRAAARRAAYVAAEPSRARTADVVALLREEGCDDAEVRATLERASARGHTATTLWTALDAHGVDACLDALRAPAPPTHRSPSSAVPPVATTDTPDTDDRADHTDPPVTDEEPALEDEPTDDPDSSPARVDLNANVRREGTGRRDAG